MTQKTRRLRSEITGDEDDVFDSGIKLIQDPNLYIGTELLAYCDAIQTKFKGLEWSIMLKGMWIPEGYTISKTFVIPEQEVDGGNVYLNDKEIAEYTAQGYNVIIHSHPFKSSNFSSSDIETLSSTAECSILYSIGEFTTATLAIRVTKGIKLVITPDIVMVQNLELPLPDNITTKIKERARTIVNSYNTDFGENYGGVVAKHGSTFQESFEGFSNVFRGFL